MHVTCEAWDYVQNGSSFSLVGSSSMLAVLATILSSVFKSIFKAVKFVSGYRRG